MAWTTPATWVAGTVLEAADLNEQLRDNMIYVHAGKPATQLIVYGGDYTGSGSGWVDVDAANLSVTLSTTTGRVLVVGAAAVSASSGHNVGVGFSLDGVLWHIAHGYGDLTPETVPINVLVLGLSVGSHTFRLQWNPFGTSSTLSANAGQPCYFGVCEL
jgi:hypothetical protein